VTNVLAKIKKNITLALTLFWSLQ